MKCCLHPLLPKSQFNVCCIHGEECPNQATNKYVPPVPSYRSGEAMKFPDGLSKWLPKSAEETMKDLQDALAVYGLPLGKILSPDAGGPDALYRKLKLPDLGQHGDRVLRNVPKYGEAQAEEERLAVESGKWLDVSEVAAVAVAGLGKMMRCFVTRPGAFGHPALLAAIDEYDDMVEEMRAKKQEPSMRLSAFLKRCRLLEKHMPTPASILVDNQEEP